MQSKQGCWRGLVGPGAASRDRAWSGYRYLSDMAMAAAGVDEREGKPNCQVSTGESLSKVRNRSGTLRTGGCDEADAGAGAGAGGAGVGVDVVAVAVAVAGCSGKKQAKGPRPQEDRAWEEGRSKSKVPGKLGELVVVVEMTR